MLLLTMFLACDTATGVMIDLGETGVYWEDPDTEAVPCVEDTDAPEPTVPVLTLTNATVGDRMAILMEAVFTSVDDDSWQASHRLVVQPGVTRALQVPDYCVCDQRFCSTCKLEVSGDHEEVWVFQPITTATPGDWRAE